MAKLDIILYPAPILHAMAEPVAQVDGTVRTLLDDLADTMYAAGGVGLAAPQINVSKRVIVIDIEQSTVGGAGAGATGLYEMVNPAITERDGEIAWEEGCLSIPDFRVAMPRSKRITCTYLDRHGKPQSLTAEDLLAVAIQHEIDHLDGKLIIDTVSSLKQELYLDKLKKRKGRVVHEQDDL